ncbi:hypothetical protein HMPREF1544_10221 [Mucor circinelloides 1006PhL]|uniref:Uncharacterized protein n=1 Tax=Mucor circinelloides f. circinelloides (strain 1006PhL) TaxID=1220926 RepID=S2JKH0_MUCC1|nr:hypothetical protein HMPREF1544_10221 [Mucor circinelloides 1006PhL]
MNKPKSILKYRPENNINYKDTSITAINPPPRTSWLSRLHSKIYSQTDISQDENDGDNPLLLAKQDLKRVTFSVGNLTTEHPFCSDDIPRDELYEKQKTDAAATKQQTPQVTDLANHYDHACIQREEGCIDRFRNLLRRNRTSQLQMIDLSRQPIAAHQAGPLSDIFILKFGLEYLNLSNCKLEDEAIRIVLCSLLVSGTIQRLDLSQNNFKSKGYKYIAIFIKESKTIQSVDLSRCTFEKKGMQYLAQGLQYATTLSKLVMDKCNIKPPPETFQSFSEGVYNATSLQTLSLRNNHFAPNQGTWIANLIAPRLNGLKDLDLSGNQVNSMLAPLAAVLRNNTSLLHLNLSNCQINHEGLSLLSNALGDNRCLEELDLSMNPLGHETDEGILALKDALTRNSCLQSLNLSETQLSSSTAIALAEALPENASLCRLDLSKNPHIDMAGILALAISIKMNHTLTFLDINIPPLDEELANLQNDIVAVCTTNMLQKVEAQQKQDSGTMSPSSSSSSSLTTSNLSLVELPTEQRLMEAKQVLDGPNSPQLEVVGEEHRLETSITTTNTNISTSSPAMVPKVASENTTDTLATDTQQA